MQHSLILRCLTKFVLRSISIAFAVCIFCLVSKIWWSFPPIQRSISPFLPLLFSVSFTDKGILLPFLIILKMDEKEWLVTVAGVPPSSNIGFLFLKLIAPWLLFVCSCHFLTGLFQWWHVCSGCQVQQETRNDLEDWRRHHRILPRNVPWHTWGDLPCTCLLLAIRVTSLHHSGFLCFYLSALLSTHP